MICANSSPSAAAAQPRRAGYTRVVLGAVLLPLGVVLAGVSAVPWSLADGGSAMYVAGGVLDGVGLASIAAGTALLAVGVGTVAGSHDRRVQLLPTLGPRSAALSLSAHF